MYGNGQEDAVELLINLVSVILVEMDLLSLSKVERRLSFMLNFSKSIELILFKHIFMLLYFSHNRESILRNKVHLDSFSILASNQNSCVWTL